MKIEEIESIETNDFRVIIFPSSRAFTAKESKNISEKLYDFLASWQYHGEAVSASFKIEKNQFIVICIDTEKTIPGGCGLDALTKVIREIDHPELDLLNRMKATYIENGVTKTIGLVKFREGLKQGTIPHNIEVFDFGKDTYLGFLSDFLLPLGRSWAQIYTK